MAFRATGNMIHMLRQAGLKGGNTRPFSTASESSGPASLKSWMKKADMAPVYIVFGFVTVAVMIAVHTAKQQLVHCPSISFDKKKRSGIPEVDEVSATTRSADKFIGKSFLRKVAHIQDESKQTLPNPIRGNVYTRQHEYFCHMGMPKKTTAVNQVWQVDTLVLNDKPTSHSLELVNLAGNGRLN